VKFPSIPEVATLLARVREVEAHEKREELAKPSLKINVKQA
jgi:hypothetical protein